jgi:hypothetical protein
VNEDLVTELNPYTADDGLISRTARKFHDCDGERDNGSWVHHRECVRVIAPGDRYVEYLGESPAYASGIRYTFPCAVMAWGFIAGVNAPQIETEARR